MVSFLKRLFGGKPESSAKEVNVRPEREWHSWKPVAGPPSAPDGYVKLSGATDVAIAGTSYRLSDCTTFLSALKGDRADEKSIKVLREYVNEEHPDAFSVYGILPHREVQLGFLPSDIGDMIRTTFPKEIPVKAALREWGKKKTGDAVFFRVTVFVPNAKIRKTMQAEQDKT